jgi:hypothetical protein
MAIERRVVLCTNHFAKRIGELEKRLARLECPAKTPDNSSLPPSQGQKPARATGDKPPRKSRPGFGRTLHPNPDRVFDAVLTACPKCQRHFRRRRKPRSRSTSASSASARITAMRAFVSERMSAIRFNAATRNSSAMRSPSPLLIRSPTQMRPGRSATPSPLASLTRVLGSRRRRLDPVAGWSELDAEYVPRN